MTLLYTLAMGDDGPPPVHNGLVLLSGWDRGSCVATATFKASDLVAVYVDWEYSNGMRRSNSTGSAVIAITPHVTFVLDYTDVLNEEDDGGMCVVNCSEALERLMEDKT